MKSIRSMLPVLALATLLSAQTTTHSPSTTPGGTDPAGNTTVNAQPQSPLLRILTPVAGQKNQANFVDVRFELLNPGVVGGAPNFLVQLDGSDPVTITTTQHTFTGLTPGTHSVTVTIVDANSNPISGGRATVQFAVAPPRAHVNAEKKSMLSKLIPAELQSDEERADAGLPASSPLPLLSVVGFGVLIGGVASAMKTR